MSNIDDTEVAVEEAIKLCRQLFIELLAYDEYYDEHLHRALIIKIQSRKRLVKRLNDPILNAYAFWLDDLDC